MSAKVICISGVLLAALAVAVSVQQTFATTLYVDDRNGHDSNPGTRESPLRTIGQAASVVNSRTESGPTTVKIAPGVYNLNECAEFKSPIDYTEKDRLVIEVVPVDGRGGHTPPPVRSPVALFW